MFSCSLGLRLKLWASSTVDGSFCLMFYFGRLRNNVLSLKVDRWLANQLMFTSVLFIDDGGHRPKADRRWPELYGGIHWFWCLELELLPKNYPAMVVHDQPRSPISHCSPGRNRPVRLVMLPLNLAQMIAWSWLYSINSLLLTSLSDRRRSFHANDSLTLFGLQSNSIRFAYTPFSCLRFLIFIFMFSQRFFALLNPISIVFLV